MEKETSVRAHLTEKNLNTREDFSTAQAFASSWENLYDACPYSDEQVREWLDPIRPDWISGKKVLEMGCGSGGLLHFVARQNPGLSVGIDLGSSVRRAAENMKSFPWVRILQRDLTAPGDLPGFPFDLVYSIGVLHHLKHPERGFSSMIGMTAHGGRFHGWVYAYEGNGLIRLVVDPLRKAVCRFPWFVTKYLVALPLAVPFYFLSQLSAFLSSKSGMKRRLEKLPLYNYLMWISPSPFKFHHHVAFDQLISPQTSYISRERVEAWLKDSRIDQTSTYLIHRNGNGWKFGGIRL